MKWAVWKERLRPMLMFVTLLGALNFYLFALFFGFFALTGRITAEKMSLVGEVLHGRLTTASPPTRLAVTPAERDAMRETIRRELQAEYSARQRETESMLSRVGQLRTDLSRERDQLGVEREQLAEERARLDTRKEEESRRTLDAEFAQNIQWLSIVEPQAGAKMLAEMSLSEALGYLRALRERTAVGLIVELVKEYERRDVRDGTALATEFQRAMLTLPGVATAPGTAPAGSAAGGGGR